MNWILAGLIAGVAAWLADWVLWSKVFMKGMDAFVTSMSPEEMKKFMGPAMVKSAALALLYGLIFAVVYEKLKASLWVQPGGWLAGMELATILWLPIALQTLGAGVWYMKTRTLQMATFWAWLIRMNVAGIVAGILLK